MRGKERNDDIGGGKEAEIWNEEEVNMYEDEGMETSTLARR